MSHNIRNELTEKKDYVEENEIGQNNLLKNNSSIKRYIFGNCIRFETTGK